MNEAHSWPGRHHRLPAVILAASALLTACGGSAGPTEDDLADERGDARNGSTAETPSTTTSSSPSNSPSGDSTTGFVLENVGPCVGSTAEELATADSPLLTEVSGAAVSRRHQGVLWVHNDNGRAPAVIAIDLEGTVLGEFPLPGVTGVDLEDLALVDEILYLGDIGDNLSQRAGIAVYRFAEPDPRADQGIDTVDVLDFTYPDRSFDAESMLVDPVTGSLVIITKMVRIGGGNSSPLSAAAAPVFVADPPFDVDDSVVLEHRGVVALDQLLQVASGEAPEGSISDLGLADVATGADIRSDGATVAVRTYRSVWLFDRRPEQSVAEALGGTPCEAASVFEQQGEAIAFLDAASDAFVTISEGANPAINISR